MKLFLDTNILVAAVTRDTERSATAVELLNEAEDAYVSVDDIGGTLVGSRREARDWAT